MSQPSTIIYPVMISSRKILASSLLFWSLFSVLTFAEDSVSPEELDVKDLKQKYWSKSNNTEVGVVQNRKYSKQGKFEVTLFGSNVNGDPFLSTYFAGGQIGYAFHEYFSVHVTALRAFSNRSTALETLETQQSRTANTNRLISFYGGELRGSILYGKLSLVGKAILYFDAYLAFGSGKIKTENGDELAIYGTIGQQIHVSNTLAINLDYKVMGYDETIVGKNADDLGKVFGRRTNISGAVSIGISIFIDP